MADVKVTRQGRPGGITPTNTSSGMDARIAWFGLPQNPMQGADKFEAAFNDHVATRLVDGGILDRIVEEIQEAIPDQNGRLNYREEPWGEDSGTMRENVTWEDVSVSGVGVAYSFEVASAEDPNGDNTEKYWESIEWGWHQPNGKFVPGGHFIGRTVDRNSHLMYMISRDAFSHAAKSTMKALGLKGSWQVLFNDGVGVAVQTEQG